VLRASICGIIGLVAGIYIGWVKAIEHNGNPLSILCYGLLCQYVGWGLYWGRTRGGAATALQGCDGVGSQLRIRLSRLPPTLVHAACPRGSDALYRLSHTYPSRTSRG
jgi:hypothetical protein